MKKKRVEIAWTEERVEVLDRLWNRSTLGPDAIAKRMGFGDRNAIMGKTNRMGWSPRPPLALRQEREEEDQRRELGEEDRAIHHTSSESGDSQSTESPQTSAVEVSAPVQPGFLEPIGESCSWRLVNTTTNVERVCGEKRFPNSPFCPPHRGEALEREQARRNLNFHR